MSDEQPSAQRQYEGAIRQRRTRRDKPKAPQTTTLPSPGMPMAVARLFIEERCQCDGVPTLHHWRGTWWLWRRSHWRERENDEVRSLLYAFTDNARYFNAEGELVPWAPNRKKIGDLLEALAAITILSNDIDQPTWLDGRSTGTIVAVANGLLEVETRRLLPHSPHFFNQTAVPFDYDKNAPEPKHWYGFLDALWPDEPAAIDVLGEWFGYVISGRLDLHKIFAMVGPTRSGKGVIARIETALLGEKNVAGPTLSSFGNEFGLEPLMGKGLAIISDARSGGGKNSPVVVERMLSISGEDTLTVHRKYKGAWNGKLPTRLQIISNELPRLGDASSAIVGRLVLLLTTRSWLGKEDYELETKLRKELSGILNWALDGLQRLTVDNENKFTRFEAAEEAITQMRDLASPVGAFVREKCKLGSGDEYEIEVDMLYDTYKDWCQVCEYPKSPKAHFGRDLRAACPSVKKTRPRDRSKRYHVYRGIRLRTEKDEAEEAKAEQAAEAGAQQELPLGEGENTSVTVTTMTKDQEDRGAGAVAGHSGHSDQLNVTPTTDSPNPAREREPPTYSGLRSKLRSDDLPYTGPVVPVPNLGSDSLNDHGVPLAQAQPANGGEPGLSRRRIQDLADWYSDQGHRRHNDGLLDTAGLDAELRAILREEVAFPEHVEIEFERVMQVVFAV
jgi:putative DNA primase/helicase